MMEVRGQRLGLGTEGLEVTNALARHMFGV